MFREVLLRKNPCSMKQSKFQFCKLLKSLDFRNFGEFLAVTLTWTYPGLFIYLFWDGHGPFFLHTNILLSRERSKTKSLGCVVSLYSSQSSEELSHSHTHRARCAGPQGCDSSPSAAHSLHRAISGGKYTRLPQFFGTNLLQYQKKQAIKTWLPEELW